MPALTSRASLLRRAFSSSLSLFASGPRWRRRTKLPTVFPNETDEGVDGDGIVRLAWIASGPLSAVMRARARVSLASAAFLP